MILLLRGFAKALTVTLFVGVSWAQTAQVSVNLTSDGAPLLSDRAKRQLESKLKSAASTDLMVIDVDGAPLEIREVKARGIKIEGNYDDPAGTAGELMNDYATKLSFRLLNRSDRRITGVGLEFTNSQANGRFFIHPHPIELEPGKSKKIDIDFMTVTGDPANLSVQVSGARFDDTSTWEGFPFPKPRKPAVSASGAALPSEVQQPVDSRPRVQNQIRPGYTVEARKNHVLGIVYIRLLVGSDGTVKQVRVVNALPDGLTEQAIRAVHQLKFEPARRNGEPVDFWMPIEVAFNLR